MPDRGLLGCNVTIPHKTAAFEAADACHPAARAVGAANTVWFENGRMNVTNTDTYGFMTHLELCAPHWRTVDRPVTLIGAGGAARAIAYGFLEAGMTEVRIVNRTRSSAEALRADFGKAIKVFEWRELPRALEGSGVLVNTTSLGMSAGEPLTIDLSPLPEGAIVDDIVYVPLETPLLAAARARGLVAVDGLGMLLHQAVPAFEKWFARRPIVTRALRDRIVADLECS